MLIFDYELVILENNYKIEVGKPWRYADFTAPFNFPIYKSEQVVQRQRDSQ